MGESQLFLGRRMVCDSAVAVDDWVYVDPISGKAELADASDIAKMPSVGYVSHKQGADLCFVKNDGIYQRVPQIFTPGDELFISTTQPGRIVVGAPGAAALLQKVGDADPDGISVIVNMEIKDIASLTVTAGGEVVRPYAAGVLLRDVVYLRADGVVDRASAAAEVTMKHRGVISSLDDPVLGQAKVLFAGDQAGFAGLTIAKMYIAGQSAGSIVAEDDTGNPNYPDTTPGSGHIRAEIGVAAKADTLLVGTLRDFDEF